MAARYTRGIPMTAAVGASLLPLQASMDFNMSINSSSIADISLHTEPTSFNSSNSLDMNPCFMSKQSLFVFAAASIINLLILLIIVLVLYLGYQQWRQQRFTSKATSHSDAFLYHFLAMDLNSFLGYTLYFFGAYFNLPDNLLLVGNSFWTVASCGQAWLHILSCAERYLAVVKPITYHRLRQTTGDRIRNISIGCVWLLSFLFLILAQMGSNELNLIVYFCVISFFLSVISFCSISILCALRRPGPGEASVNRQQVDQYKQKAFYTILAIMGTLLFRFGGHLINTITQISIELSPNEQCLLSLFDLWFDLPSTLVLPLLFLQRVRKLQHYKQSSESG